MIHKEGFEQQKGTKGEGSWLSFLFDQEDWKEDKKSDKLRDERVQVFEAGLAQNISEKDTIEESIVKMVKVALALEFGVSMTREKGFAKMASNISRGIMAESELRKQALLVVDKVLNHKKEMDIDSIHSSKTKH